MDLSIIIVNWNSREDLQQCIPSILRHTHDMAYEIVVIDSGSFDGSDRLLKENYPQVRFIQSFTNLGFAKANNRAFEDSVGDVVLFLNPDTELRDAAIDTLYAAVRALPTAGVVGCKLLNSDGSVQTSCLQAFPTILNKLLDADCLRTRWPKARLWGMAALFEAPMNPTEVQAVSGACLMIRRDRFRQLGSFTEDYFMYTEDVDLAHKAIRAGYKNYYVPRAAVIHHGGKSSSKVRSTFGAVMMANSTWRFLRKTRGRAYATGFRLSVLLSSVARVLLLLAIAPLSLSRGRHRSWLISLRKWLATLWWSVSRKRVARRYCPRDWHAPSPATSATAVVAD